MAESDAVDLRALVQRLREYADGERTHGFAAEGDAMAAAADALEATLAPASPRRLRPTCGICGAFIKPSLPTTCNRCGSEWQSGSNL